MKIFSKKILAMLLIISMVMMFVACSTDEEYEAAPDENGYVLEAAEETIRQPGQPGGLFQADGAQEPEEPEPEPEPEPDRFYIALGDSVSAGYGIHSSAYRHSDIFFEMLYQSGVANEYVNIAVDGMTTTGLLRLLQDMPEEDLYMFENAAVITLNIGGNNILRPFLDYLPDADEVAAMVSETMDLIEEAIDTINRLIEFFEESQDTITEVVDFATDIMGVVNNFSIGDVMRLREFINRASVIDDAVVVFDGFAALESDAMDIFNRATELQMLSALAVLGGNFSPQLAAQLNNGVRTFEYEFAEIITWLENNAPDALIIVNTVYNPIPRDISGFSLEISNQAHSRIREINQIIHRQSTGGAFIVSDVYTILSNAPQLSNFSLDFVHPNPAGHSLIAQRNFQDFLVYVGR